MRSTVVEAADQAATSSLEKKVEAAAAAKPSMRSPRVTRSTASTDPDGACCKPAVGRPAQSLHTGALTNGRCSADVLGGSSTRSPRHLGPACKETWDHTSVTFAPFAGRVATRATVVATDATREQHEEQFAVDGGGSPSAVPTVGASDAGASVRTPIV